MSKIIVLTGATRGLGRALVPVFVAGGHTVIGCGRSEKQLAELWASHPAPHSFDAIDVTNPDAVERWANRRIAKFGPPDLLINNAAIMNTPAPLWTINPDEFDMLIDVNVKGLFHVIRAFVPAMVTRRRGTIVNLSSGWGRSTSPEVAPYCASKYAVEGMTLALAQEFLSILELSIPICSGRPSRTVLRLIQRRASGRIGRGHFSWDLARRIMDAR